MVNLYIVHCSAYRAPYQPYSLRRYLAGLRAERWLNISSRVTHLVSADHLDKRHCRVDEFVYQDPRAPRFYL